MINSAPDETPASQTEAVETIVAAGPHGAMAVAGIATLVRAQIGNANACEPLTLPESRAGSRSPHFSQCYERTRQ